MTPEDPAPKDPTADSAALVAWLAEAPREVGLLTDFDGTLAPIVDDPTTSALPEAMVATLSSLARHLGLVAVVSGRPLAFLGERVDDSAVELHGLYGLERRRDGATVTHPRAEAWVEVVTDARDRLTSALAGWQGVTVEDKRLSVAVHWRRAPDRTAAERAVSALVDDLGAATGLLREPGKLVAELRPPLSVDKGDAVRLAVADRQLRRLVYLGDDRGDLVAFEAVRQVAGARGLAVAVDHGPETPAEVRAAADLVLDGTDATARLLDDLDQLLGA